MCEVCPSFFTKDPHGTFSSAGQGTGRVAGMRNDRPDAAGVNMDMRKFACHLIHSCTEVYNDVVFCNSGHCNIEKVVDVDLCMDRNADSSKRAPPIFQMGCPEVWCANSVAVGQHTKLQMFFGRAADVVCFAIECTAAIKEK